MKEYIILTVSLLWWTSAQSQQVFDQIYFGSPSSMASCIAINSQDHIFLGTYYNEGVYRSTDNGQNWTKVKPHPNVKDVFSIAIHPSGYIIVGMDGSSNDAKGVFVSTDNGDSYVRMSSGLPVGSPTTVAVAPNGYVYTNVGKDVYCSTDTCKSWVIKSTGLTGSVSVDQIACAPNGYLFLYKSKYIFRSTDNGDHWTEMTNGWTQDSIWDIMISKKGHFFIATNQQHIYRSTDNGDSWNRVTGGLQVSGGKVVGLGEDGQGNIYAGSQGTDLVANLHRSTNDGVNWSLLGTAVCWNVLACVTFDSEGYCYASCGGSLQKSSQRMLSVGDDSFSEIPNQYGLNQNYPNPFNSSTVITYLLPDECRVQLRLFNILGEEVATLVDEERGTGVYSLRFNASGLPSGLYFYRLEAGSFSDTKRLLLVR